MMMNIGYADDEDPQHWVLHNGLQSSLPLGLTGAFIRPDQVPADLRFDGATHVLQVTTDQVTQYMAYQLKETEVELLGYGLDLPEDSDYDEENEDLADSKYSDVPLNLGDEFLFIYDEKTKDKTERSELHSGVRYDAFGSLTTPDGTFDALRFTSQDTTFLYKGDATTPYTQTYAFRVGWITKEGTYFDGEIRRYDPATGEASLALMNYQTITMVAPLSLTAPTYDCTTGVFHFNTSGGENSPIEYYAAPGITGWTTNPDQVVDQQLRTAADAKPIELKARQNGVEVSLLWDIRQACPVDGQPPVSTGPFGITGVTGVSCTTLSATQRQVSFSPAYIGLSDGPVSFSVANELLPTTNPGPYSLTLYLDNPVIGLRAEQNGQAASYAFNWTQACDAGSHPPVSEGPFSITGVSGLTCLALSATQRQVSFTPRYAGLNGQPVRFEVINEMVPTTNSGPYTLNLYTDNPAITLRAEQVGTAGAVTYRLNWLAECSAMSGRQGVAEVIQPLGVVVLGNPTGGETVSVEIRGAAGEPVRLNVLDSHGRSIDSSTVGEASSVERASVRLGKSAGVYLLQVATPTRKQVVRLIRQ